MQVLRRHPPVVAGGPPALGQVARQPIAVGRREIQRDGVTIVGLTNLPSTMPTHASQLLSRNIAAVLGLIVADGAVALDWDDEIVAGACVTRKEVAA